MVSGGEKCWHHFSPIFSPRLARIQQRCVRRVSLWIERPRRGTSMYASETKDVKARVGFESPEASQIALCATGLAPLLVLSPLLSRISPSAFEFPDVAAKWQRSEPRKLRSKGNQAYLRVLLKRKWTKDALFFGGGAGEGLRTAWEKNNCDNLL